jgi:CHASE2 domain-containing sensor protein
MRIIVVLIVTLVATSCKSKYGSPVAIEGGKDQTIVLLNGAKYDRITLSEALNKVCGCKPAVVAINYVFLERRSESDTLLSNAIKSCEKVVLAENIKADGQTEKSNSLFLDNATSSGIASHLVNEDNVVTDFFPLFENYPGQSDSFASEITFAFFPTEEIYLKFHIDESRPIKFVRDLENFLIIDTQNIKCEELRDKIVIIGDLGPGDRNTFKTSLDMVKGKNTRTYSTVIVANEVLNMLEVLGYNPGQAEN